MRQLVIAGLSGSGKTTAANLLVDRGLARHGITCTTRAPRPGEVDGSDYDFLTEAEFAATRENGGLAEETKYIGTGGHYGILRRRIDEARQADLRTIWIVDHNGLHRLEQLFPGEVRKVFLWAERDELRRRMTARGDEPGSIERRLATVVEELAIGIENFFPCVLNTTRMSPALVAEMLRELLTDERRTTL